MDKMDFLADFASSVQLTACFKCRRDKVTNVKKTKNNNT